MRIIDWISDVVSSDLGLVPRLSGLNLASAARGQAMPGAARWCCDGDSKRARRVPASRCLHRCHPHPSPPPSKGEGKILKAQENPLPPCGGGLGWGDRKSVVEGKMGQYVENWWG